MKHKKLIRTTSLALTASAITVPFAVQAEENPFSDIKEGNSTYESVTTLAQEGIINGYPDGTYRPDEKLSKKQAAMLFSKSLKLDRSGSIDEDDFPFEHVSVDAKVAPFVNSLYQEGILTEDDDFVPTEELTREEMAEWLMRTFDLKALDSKETVIPDFSEVNEDYQQAVVSLYHNDITKGMKDGSFAPKETVNRGQFAIFLYRALNNQPIDRVQEFDDIYTALDVSPMLPNQANVLLNDGTVVEKEVTWHKTDLDLSSKGSYTVEGLVKGTLETVTLTVHVGQKQVEDISGFEDINYILGEDLELPESVDVTYDDDTSEQLNVGWDDTNITEAGDYLVKGTIEEINQEISVNVHAEDPSLTVEEAWSPNLREIKAQFNITPKNLEKANDLASYTVTDENGQEVELDSIHFNEENDEVTLVTSFPLTKGEGSIEVSDQLVEESYSSSLSFEDNEAPTLSKAVAVGPRQVEIQFSEPVDLPTNDEGIVTKSKYKQVFKINDSFTHVHELEKLDHGKTYLVTFATEFVKGENQLSVEDTVQDYNYQSIDPDEDTESFIYQEQTSFTELTDWNVANPYEINLQFEHPLTLLDEAEDGIYVLQGDEKLSPEEIEMNDSRQVTLTFSSALQDNNQLVLEEDTLRDYWKNKNEEIVNNLELQEDSTAPKLKNVSVIDEEEASSSNVQLQVTFDEPVEMQEDTKVRLYSSDGQSYEIELIDQSQTNRSSLTVTLDVPYGELPEDEYTFLADNMEDLYGNTSDQDDIEFVGKSLTTPGNFTGNVFSKQDELIFTVNYGQEMAQSGDQAVNLLNQYEMHYKDESILLSELDNKSDIQINLELNESADQSKIFVKYSSEDEHHWIDALHDIEDSIADEQIDFLQLNVGKVATEAGMATKSFYNPVELQLQQPFTVQSAQAVDEDTIKVQLNHEMENYNEEDIVIFTDLNRDDDYDRGEELSFTTDYKTNNHSTTLTIDIEEDSEYQIGERDLYVTTAYDSYSTDTYGQVLNIDPYLIEDSIPAQVKEDDVSLDETDDGNAKITLPFTGEIDGTTVSRLTFEMDNEDLSVQEVEVDGNEIHLIVDFDGEDVDELVGETVKQAFPFMDEKGNELSGVEVEIKK